MSDDFYEPLEQPTIELLRAAEIQLLRSALTSLEVAVEHRASGSAAEFYFQRNVAEMLRAAQQYALDLMELHEAPDGP